MRNLNPVSIIYEFISILSYQYSTIVAWVLNAEGLCAKVSNNKIVLGKVKTPLQTRSIVLMWDQILSFNNKINV